MTTLRQIAANQMNALKSTGPTTEAGKARARGNALKHGLAGDGVVTDDATADLVEQRCEAWRGSYELSGDEDRWAFHQYVAETIRVDLCESEERRARTYLAHRASFSWDVDHRLEAEETARSLARRPSLVASRLERCSHGCAWLLGRWENLGAALSKSRDDAGPSGWTDDETSLAFDLLGTHAEARLGDPFGPDETAAGLVEREIHRLERQKTEALDVLDDLERDAAECGVPVTPVRELERLRRYENACLRRMQLAWKRVAPLRNAAPAFEPPADAGPPPPAAKPVPAPVPAPPNPPSVEANRATEREVEAQVDVVPFLSPSPAPSEPRRSEALPPRGNRRARRAALKHASRR